MSFKTRAITGLTFAAVVIGCIFAHQYSFAILFVVISVFCLKELFTHAQKDDNKRQRQIRKWAGIAISILPLIAIDYSLLQQLPLVPIITPLLFLMPVLFFLFFIYELFTRTKAPFTNVSMLALGLLYIIVPFTLLSFVGLGQGEFRPALVFGMLILVWAGDTTAYMAGSRIGKNKFFPRISPNKTWEGTISGGVGALIASGLCFFVFTNLGLSLLEWLGLGLVIAIFGPLGDLVESMFKRSLSIKDTGTILPGHGGSLDRFDAFIFVIPFATLYLYLIGQM